MSRLEATNQDRPANDGKSLVRKTYAKSEFQHEKVLETMALSCGKVHSTQSGCHYSRKNS